MANAPTVHVDLLVEEGLAAQWDEPLTRGLIAATVRAELGPGAYTLALHLVSDATIHHLNRDHRGVDAPTDVLSFGLHDPDGMRFTLPPGEPTPLGDVVISHERALAQAAEYGHPPAREMAYLATHGTLHVLGYDHEAEADRERMRQREEDALAGVGLSR